MSRSPALNVAVLHQQAMLFYQSGNRQRADGIWRVVLNADPRHSDSIFMLGVLALEAGDPVTALANFDHALMLRPRAAAYHDTRGDALESIGRMPEAMGAWRTAISFDANLQAPLVSLGTALAEAGELEEAASMHRRALTIDPNSPAALNGLGLTLLRLRDYPLAESSLRAALIEAPDMAAIHNNLGTLLREQDRLIEAEICIQAALNLAPGMPSVLYNLALSRLAAMRMTDAEALLRETLRNDPGHADAHHSLAILLLGSGRFEEGWDHDKWRRQATPVTLRFPEPVWNGDDLAGRTLLILADDRIGDFINFCRFVPLASLHGRVVVEVPAPLVRLVLRLSGISQVVPSGRPLPHFDLYCSATSLWRVFRAMPNNMPVPVPYLFPDKYDVLDWRQRLAGLPGIKVGLAWSGNPVQREYRACSIPSALLKPLAAVSGVSFVSLQKGILAEPVAGLELHDWTSELLDLADMAALLESLDLVISVDTNVAHLAGAAGRPIWLLNRDDGQTDPRWMQGRSDSYWYPAMRIFRQPGHGDWQPVIHEVCAALDKMTHA